MLVYVKADIVKPFDHINQTGKAHAIMFIEAMTVIREIWEKYRHSVLISEWLMVKVTV